MNPALTVFRADQPSEELYAACQRLVPQLTNNNPPPSRQDLALMLASPASILFAARHADFGDEIIGLATLILYRVPTGLRGYIEDVIVDERARGRRIGEALTQACLEHARQAGAAHVDWPTWVMFQVSDRILKVTCAQGQSPGNRFEGP